MRHEGNRRRVFLIAAGAAGAAALLDGCAVVAGRAETAVEVGPIEDLMREHGVARRTLLVYREIIRRAEAGEPIPVAAITESARIIRAFVEDYHEQLEEGFIFPRLERAGRVVEIVRVLEQQHRVGRRLTDEVLRLAEGAAVKGSAELPKLVTTLREFIRMYEPHTAFEDTVVFPAFHELVGEKEFRELGDTFEETEHTRFGPRGFEDTVAKVARIEQTLGIGDLAQFTAPTGT